MSIFKDRTTPGVYITELAAFPASIVGVATAVPAFIGYTQQALVDGKSVLMQPVAITSMADFEQIFGTAYNTIYDINPVAAQPNFTANGEGYLVAPVAGQPRFQLYYSMRLFFANGGGNCYVVSAGDYTSPVTSNGLLAGLQAISQQAGPTILVAPDAALLPTLNDFTTVTQAMLTQCQTRQDRVAIFDVYEADTVTESNADTTLDSVAKNFRDCIPFEPTPSYGMAYFPFLNTSVVQPSEISSKNFDHTQLHQILPTLDSMTPEDEAVWTNLRTMVAAQEGVLSPGGAMAGIFTLNDVTRGVWNAPANLPVANATSPTINLSDAQQGKLNVPLDGRAIDVIRYFPSRGTTVWGARTLDGNSNDWRYIQVRRTIIYIKTSIQSSLNQFVFAPNDAATWTHVTQMIAGFLQNLWAQGGLMGSQASDAFTVSCGVPQSMTATDILNGYMIVQVTLQMIHPAEFIELTFKQTMQGS